jgi:hypothetical protein
LKTVSFISPALRRLEASPTNVVALFLFRERRPLRGITGLVDWRLYGHLSRVVIEGFFEGDFLEQLLVPLGRHLPQHFLLVTGLGDRESFDKQVFLDSVAHTFDAVERLDERDIALALPGRVEGVCPTSDAIDWFIEGYDGHGEPQEIAVIEPHGAQKTMIPAVERWRLRQLVP